MGFKGDTALSMVDGRDFHKSLKQIAGAHGGHEAQVLRQIDRAVSGKLFAHHGRNQAGGQHTMGDAPLEHGVAGVIVV